MSTQNVGRRTPLVPLDPAYRHIGAHTVHFHPPRLLRFVVRGDLSGQDLDAMEVFAVEHVGAQPYLLGIVEITLHQDATPEARKAAARAMTRLPYRALAFVGANFQTRILAKLVIGAVRLVAPDRFFPMAFFETEAQARAWLEEREREVPAGRAGGL